MIVVYLMCCVMSRVSIPDTEDYVYIILAVLSCSTSRIRSGVFKLHADAWVSFLF